VVGGGFIGLEVAASARKLGAKAVVIEREARLLQRVVCPELSDYFARRHREAGVDLKLGATVAGFEGECGNVSAVLLADGGRIPCDVALVGIGALAEDGLARAAGLACDNGITVDLTAQTSDPDVFAVGDCTNRPMPIYDRMFRLESVPNALEQANQATRAICGKPPPPAEVPWFWSDQYDIRLQIAGLPFESAHTVLRGSVTDGKFAVFHQAADNRVICVEAVSFPQAMAVGKMMIGKRLAPDPSRLADETVPLKELLR
jgi:3-phenylpropionate/trans-cinnamate dioxygenase ferredoxin reductase subunit